MSYLNDEKWAALEREADAKAREEKAEKARKARVQLDINRTIENNKRKRLQWLADNPGKTEADYRRAKS